MTEINKFRHWVTLQRQINTKSASGHKKSDYEDVEELWAQIEPMEGEELQEGDKLTSFIPQQITTRFSRDINSTCRFMFIDDDIIRYFNVMSSYSPKEERVFSVSKCREDTSVTT